MKNVADGYGRALLSIALAFILMAAAPAPRSMPVPLSAQQGTWRDQAARKLVADDLAEAGRAGEKPLVLVGSARLGTAAKDREALFVQLQSARECGSAGCGTSVYLWRDGMWKRVLDGANGKLSVSASRTKGMADLLTDKDRYVWTGSEYRDPHPGPQIDLRPRAKRS